MTFFYEVGGLVAVMTAIFVIALRPVPVPLNAHSTLLGLLVLLGVGHTANILELQGAVWADTIADHLSVGQPLLWALFLLEIGRGYLSSHVEAGQAQLRFFLEAVPASVASVDEDGRLEAFSREWAVTFPDTVLGQPFESALPCHLSQLAAALARCAADESPSVGRERVEDGDLERHYRWAVRSWRHPDRRGPNLLVFVEDITEAIAAEGRKVDAAAELAKIQRLADVGQLAAGAAHDFNNLLQVIEVTLTELELDGVKSSTFETLRGSAKAAATLTKAMLQFGRSNATVLGPTDLSALVRDVAVLLSRAVGSKHELVVSIPPDRPVMVRGNAGRLQQVILNLVLNARDAMPRGGAIHLSVEQRTDAAILRVRDDGVGIPEALQAKLFVPFFTTKGEHGTGLGLGVVKSAVEEHHGAIDVNSIPGRGTTFSIQIPLIEP